MRRCVARVVGPVVSTHARKEEGLGTLKDGVKIRIGVALKLKE